jgi:hypothetical protein
MRIIVLIFTFLIGLNSFSQNKQVLYDFAGLPQTLLLNPGLETDYKFHIGVPLLSGISSEIKSTGFSLSEIFAVNNKTINDKINTVLNKIDANDYLKVNTQIEVFSGGYRFDKNTYVSFGFYQELDAIGYLPSDALTLINEGNNSYLNRSFSVSEILYKLDVLGVIHAGVSRKVSNKLTLGGRFKVYSSALNLETTNNQGTFTTRLGNNNIYTHHLDNINYNARTSGLISNNEYISASTFIENSLLGGNLGAGIDLGFTYHVTPQLQFSGSLIDLGFVHHTKDIKNNLIAGSYKFEGIEFEFDSNRDYWQELDAALKEQLPIVDNQDSYTSRRPAKVNAAMKYSFGEKRSKYCYDNTLKDFYTNAFGVQLYSVFRPLRQQFAFTSFYEKSFSNILQAKITHTIDDYSYYNIGVGVSAKIWKINFYGILDNLTKLSDISSANNVSLQFGFNLLFN